jgi:hypothetical protein
VLSYSMGPRSAPLAKILHSHRPASHQLSFIIIEVYYIVLSTYDVQSRFARARISNCLDQRYRPG